MSSQQGPGCPTGCLGCCLGPPLAVVGFFMAVGVLFHALASRSTRDWSVTDGRLLSAETELVFEGDEEFSPTYGLRVSYEYRVDGEGYVGSRMTVVGGRVGPLSEMEARLADYPVGGSVAVLYDPEDPSRAVLRRNDPPRLSTVVLGGFLLFGGLGLFVMAPPTRAAVTWLRRGGSRGSGGSLGTALVGSVFGGRYGVWAKWERGDELTRQERATLESMIPVTFTWWESSLETDDRGLIAAHLERIQDRLREPWFQELWSWRRSFHSERFVRLVDEAAGLGAEVDGELREGGASVEEAGVEGAQEPASHPERGQWARRFDDDLADRIRWGPLVLGGANFRTRGLVRTRRGRLVFRASLATYAFCLLPGAFGALMMSTRHAWTTGSGDPASPLMIGLAGAAFFGLSAFLVYRVATPKTFDTALGYYWRGRGAPPVEGPASQSCVRLSDVHAVQLVTEVVSDDESSFTSYEINLVLGDGRRVNVVDHGNLERILSDAETLSSELGVPLWKAV